jgi:hypothetical protein
MSLTSDVLAYLIAQSVGTAKTIFADIMPASPQAAMCVYQYAGRTPEFNTGGDVVSRPMLQIKVRHQSASTGWAWLKSAETALMGVSNEALSGTFYQSVRPVSSAFMNGWTNNSIFLIQNFEACRSE